MIPGILAARIFAIWRPETPVTEIHEICYERTAEMEETHEMDGMVETLATGAIVVMGVILEQVFRLRAMVAMVAIIGRVPQMHAMAVIVEQMRQLLATAVILDKTFQLRATVVMLGKIFQLRAMDVILAKMCQLCAMDVTHEQMPLLLAIAATLERMPQSLAMDGTFVSPATEGRAGCFRRQRTHET